MALLRSIVHPPVLWTGCKVDRDPTMMDKAPFDRPARSPCVHRVHRKEFFGERKRGQVTMGAVWGLVPMSHSPMALEFGDRKRQLRTRNQVHF